MRTLFADRVCRPLYNSTRTVRASMRKPTKLHSCNNLYLQHGGRIDRIDRITSLSRRVLQNKIAAIMQNPCCVWFNNK